MTKVESEIINKLEIIVKPYLGKEIVVTPESHLINDLGLDSIDMVDVVLLIEEAFMFSIKFDDADFDKLLTVNDLVHLIKEKSNGVGNR
jgi:acyl carrier protein